MAGRNDLMEYSNEQVCMRSSEYRYVHWDSGRVRFVQTHTKISFARQQQQYKYTDVNQSHAS